ncbi:hypothetical protein CLOP_g7268 [Closterium sp. NIES-67]|nr:hypothetical protein CLOP_g7268 [Closterium sp. NIES-67]
MATRALVHSHCPSALQPSRTVSLSSNFQRIVSLSQSGDTIRTTRAIRAKLFTRQPTDANPVKSRSSRKRHGSIVRAGGRVETESADVNSSNADVAEVADDAAVPPAVITDLIAFLQQELPKLFVEGGMSSARFADKVEFEDPITRYDTLAGYLFNIQMLRYLFHPVFILQDTYQSGPAEITTRWTMKMYFWLLPWRPEVVFTGLSIYAIDPRSQQFVREYPAFQVVQLNTPVQSASDIWPSAPGAPPSPQLEKLQRYFQEGNSQRKTIPQGPIMLISPPDSAGQDKKLAMAISLDASPSTPTDPDLTIGTLLRGTWAAAAFGGLPLAETFSAAAASLRADVTADGLLLASRGSGTGAATAAAGSGATDGTTAGSGIGATDAEGAGLVGAASALVSYPSGSPIPFLKRNEVLYKLEHFSLDSTRHGAPYL